MHNLLELTWKKRKLFVLLCLWAFCFSGCHRSAEIEIHGRVIDDATGKAVSNAKVELKSVFTQIANSYSEKMSMETDQDGSFHFSNLKYRYTSSSSTDVRLRVTRDGYDMTKANIDSPRRYSNGIVIRLQEERPEELPRGYLVLREVVMKQDEPTIRLVFQDDELQLADPDQAADLELNYRFKPDGQLGWNPGLGSTMPSKCGRYQYLAKATTLGNRIAQVFYRETVGHPPRLPDLAMLELHSFCSFEDELLQLSSTGFLRHDFLLKTRSGKYALLHFNGDAINWVYQPNGTPEIWRTRNDNWQWMWF